MSGKNGWSMAMVEQLQQQGKIAGYNAITSPNISKIRKQSKYNANKKEVDGIVFDSSKEANRYVELKILRNTGHITNLQLQVPYELNEGGTHSLKYVADFVYTDVATGMEVVEDTKGFKTKEYIKKRRLMKTVHGIIIHET